MIEKTSLPDATDLARGTAAGVGPRVLDAQALTNLAQLDPTGASKLLPRVLTAYRGSLARLLPQLAAARAPLDLGTLKLVTHTLKSSSASIGALALSALCGAAELALRENRPEALPCILDDLLAEAAQVDAAVLQLLSSR
jgi:HPt (histidine-containing phosphotransfer) domain-containing protein